MDFFISNIWLIVLIPLPIIWAWVVLPLIIKKHFESIEGKTSWKIWEYDLTPIWMIIQFILIPSAIGGLIILVIRFIRWL